MTTWPCLPAVVVALVVFDTPSAAVRSEGQPSRSSATALIVGQVVDAASGKPVAAAAVSLSGAADIARGAGSPAEQRVLTGADGRFVFRDLPAGNFTINSSKLGYVDGASGRRRPGGPSQAIALGDGARAGVISIRMWKVGAIVGTLIDEAGEPLVNVQVRAFRRVTLAGRTRFVNGAVALTDDRGLYRLGNLLPGEYIVAAIARQVAVPLVMAQELQTGAFPGPASLGPPPSLPGTASSTQLGDTVLSLGRGVPIPAPSGGRLFVYPPTFYPSVATFPQATSITVASGEERSAIDLQLQPLPTARVSGVVIGPEGPATALTLRLFPTTGEDVALDLDAPVAITSRTGAFAFPAVPAGHYSLRTAIRTGSTNATPPTDTLLWADLRLAVGGSDIDGLAIALQPGLRVSGRLEFEGAGKRPVAGGLQQVPILIEPADVMPGRDLPTIAARVGADGQFTSAGLKPGKYVVRVGGSPTGWMFRSAMYKGQEVADEPFDLHTADALDVVIRFTDRWTGLRGVVQSARGSADGDATVLVYPVDRQAWTGYGLNGRRVRSVRTGRSGEYSLHSLPQGEYYVVAIPDDRAGDWQDTQFLEALAPVAARIAIGEGDQKLLGLRTRDPR